MDIANVGGLVKLAGGGPQLNGIIFDIPSKSKVVVAVVDPSRGPIFRTVHPVTLTERTEDAPDDRALRLLIRRTPSPARGAAGSGSAAGRLHAGHTRGATHRPTGR